MEIFSFLALAASIMCTALALVVFRLNRRATLNMLFTTAALFGAYWAFTESMMWQASNPENAFVWERAGFLWSFFVVFAVHFAIVFTESKLAKGKLIYLVLYLPAIAFSLIGLTTDQLYGTIVKEYWGYAAANNDFWITLTTDIWSGGFSIFAAIITIRYYLKVTDKTKKLQAKCIAIGLSIPVFTYAITNIAFPQIGVKIPNLGNISTGILIGLIAYAIWKYELFSINPALAAENIISTMPDSLVLADTKGKIIKVNKALVNFLKYTEMELIDKSIPELFLDKKHAITILKELTEKREITNIETKLRTKSGEEETVTISGSIVRSNRGQDIGITCILHDITERKEMENKLVKAERFASIGELAGMIGHDLRNPLTSIRGATYYLKTKYADKMGNTEKEMFKTIERSIEYSDKIITDLLDYSRVIKLDLETITPKQLMSNVLSIIQTPQNIEVQNLTKDHPVIKVDMSKMSRVFANIIKNAFDSMPNGGTLTITCKKSNRNLAVYFMDTGDGMSKETLSKLWTPLFTTKAKGMGFGLPICKRIVEAHGGRISVESVIGTGTTITVTIPLDMHPSIEKETLCINEPAFSLTIAEQTAELNHKPKNANL
jgi:PAS domain S-box-containing protein